MNLIANFPGYGWRRIYRHTGSRLYYVQLDKRWRRFDMETLAVKVSK